MSILAFEVLDSSWTWRMTVSLIVLESMVGLVGFNWQSAKRESVDCLRGCRRRSMMASAFEKIH